MTRGAPSREWLNGQHAPEPSGDSGGLPTWGAIAVMVATRLVEPEEARWSGTTDELRAAYYDGSEP